MSEFLASIAIIYVVMICTFWMLIIVPVLLFAFIETLFVAWEITTTIINNILYNIFGTRR